MQRIKLLKKKTLLLVFSGGGIARELLFFPLFSTFSALNLSYSCSEYQLLHFYIKEESVKFSLMPQGWAPKDRFEEGIPHKIIISLQLLIPSHKSTHLSTTPR